MTMTYRGTVAIISLAFYIPAFFLSLFISYIQGPGNNAAYVYLALFEAIRITGFSIQLFAESTDPYDDPTFANTTYYTWVAILFNIGMSPLLLSTVGMLSRVDGAVGRRMASILLMIALPIMLALALCIAGSIDPTSQEGPTFSANGEIKAAVAVYLLCFLQLCYATILILFRHHLAKRDNQLLARIVAASLPFMLVRVLYLMLFAFADRGNSEYFNVISGDETTQLCMQVLQEYAIVLLYSVAGLFLTSGSRERERVIEEAHPGLVELEKKRGRVKRACRYVPVVFWFITLREIGTLQEH